EESKEHGSDSGESCRRLPGIELAVVLPATNVNSGQSGVRVLMEEHVLPDVESPLDPLEDHDCGAVKRSAIRELIRKEKVDFLAIQETKVETVTPALCYAIWGGENCQWASLPASANSGGISSIWNMSSFSLIFSFICDGFVGVCLEWGATKKVCCMVNVYSSCDLMTKRRMWQNLLMSKRGFGGGAWCVLGDFNAVLHRDERRGLNQLGTSPLPAEIVEFRDFVTHMDLIDLPLLRRKFTR
ncbi:LINE-1 reverse transcriptase like, partial [Trifolium medium]|nr:LINE-1 reverse transcriptase like [Trifolium medium]